MKRNLKHLYELNSDFVEHFGVYGIEGIHKSEHEFAYQLIALAQDLIEIAAELNLADRSPEDDDDEDL